MLMWTLWDTRILFNTLLGLQVATPGLQDSHGRMSQAPLPGSHGHFLPHCRSLHLQGWYSSWIGNTEVQVC